MIPTKLKCHYWSAIWASVERTLYGYLVFKRIYNKRHELFALGEIKNNLHLSLGHDYWRANNTERYFGHNNKPLSYTRCWYGDENFQKDNNFYYPTATSREKKRQARKWWWRNSDWNNKARIGLKFKNGFTVENTVVNEGFHINSFGENVKTSATTWRNETYHGKQCVILKLKGSNELYFRYSYTLPLHKFNPIRLLGYRYKNLMMGVETRYIFKFRFFK